MQIVGIPFTITDWEEVIREEQTGDTGRASVRAVEVGGIRMRMVEYTADYSADHWCDRGHVVLVLEGEIVMEFEGDRTFTVGPGTSFLVADDPHKVYAKSAAKLFVVD